MTAKARVQDVLKSALIEARRIKQSRRADIAAKLRDAEATANNAQLVIDDVQAQMLVLDDDLQEIEARLSSMTDTVGGGG